MQNQNVEEQQEKTCVFFTQSILIKISVGPREDVYLKKLLTINLNVKELLWQLKKHYSRTWYEGNGRVLVSKDGSKEEQLRVIAKNIPKVNLPKPSTKKKPKSTGKKVKKGSAYRQKTR